MNDLISVILPIYKVEKYLSKCVNSIINQTYKNLEIILVDDGSPDNCGNLCDDLAKIDNRIKVIHKENGGLSDARNAGIVIAKGKYIVFVDPDDYVHENYIKSMYKNIIDTDSDISMCDFNIVYEDEDYVENNLVNLDINVFNGIDALKNLYNKDFMMQTVVAWNKLYKATLWQDIKYPKGKIHEDEFVIHILLNNCKRVVYTNEKLYYYLQRKSSITGKGTNIKTLDKFEALKNRTEFFKKNNYLELYNQSIYALCILSRFEYIDVKDKNLKRKLKEIFLENYSAYMRLEVPLKKKIKLWISKYVMFAVAIKKRLNLSKLKNKRNI